MTIECAEFLDLRHPLFAESQVELEFEREYATIIKQVEARSESWDGRMADESIKPECCN